MGYLEERLRTYTDALASGASTPGGGSAAALVGALGAALKVDIDKEGKIVGLF